MPVFAVTTAKGANWDHARDIREQPFWDQHAAFADGLVERGVIILGGPVDSDDDEDIALMAVEAPDLFPGVSSTHYTFEKSSRSPCAPRGSRTARRAG